MTDCNARRMKLLHWFQWRADRTGTVFEADAWDLRSLEFALRTNGLQLENEEGVDLVSEEGVEKVSD